MKKPSLKNRGQTAADFLRATTPGEVPEDKKAPHKAPQSEELASPSPPQKTDAPYVSATYRITKEQRDTIRRVAYERALSRERGGADLSEVVREALDAWIHSRK